MGQSSTGTLADKIDRLFEVIRRPDREQYRNEEVATACREATGESSPPPTSGSCARVAGSTRPSGTWRRSPSSSRSPPAYFFDDEQGAGIAEELELLGALRDSAVRQIALRAVTLSPRGWTPSAT